MGQQIIVYHVSGAQRGEREQFSSVERVRFGRHPDNDVAFNPQKDIDASANHAEIRKEEDGFVLVDVGSSNGTFVQGTRGTRWELPLGRALEVQFGQGGPTCRVIVVAAGDAVAHDLSSATASEEPAASQLTDAGQPNLAEVRTDAAGIPDQRIAPRALMVAGLLLVVGIVVLLVFGSG